MARGERIPKKELIPELNGDNKIWFEEYKTYERANPTYIDNLRRLLRAKIYDNKPFSMFTIIDIMNFLAILDRLGHKPNSKNNYVNAANSFRGFLIEKYPGMFGSNFLGELISLIEKNESTPERIALNPDQLYWIRKYADVKSKPLTIYIFELYFQLGIPKKDIQFCTVENADLEKMHFKTDKEPISYNNVIQNLLLKYRNELANANLSVYSASDKFETLTSWLIKNNVAGHYADSPLCYEDIRLSHSLYVLTCPVCQRKHENLASNWVLAKTKIETEYRLACIQCKGVPQ